MTPISTPARGAPTRREPRSITWSADVGPLDRHARPGGQIGDECRSRCAAGSIQQGAKEHQNDQLPELKAQCEMEQGDQGDRGAAGQIGEDAGAPVSEADRSGLRPEDLRGRRAGW